MGDTTVPPTSSPAKTKKPKKKTAADAAKHPKYIDMIEKAIQALKSRHGTSRQAIRGWIEQNYTVADNFDNHMKRALIKGVKDGKLTQIKGKGASGSFKLAADTKKVKTAKGTKGAKGKKVKTAVKPKTAKKTKTAAAPKKPAAKKSTVKKSTAKKSTAKKPAAKKPAAKKPVAKKAVAKKPAKTPTKKSSKKPAKR